MNSFGSISTTRSAIVGILRNLTDALGDGGAVITTTKSDATPADAGKVEARANAMDDVRQGSLSTFWKSFPMNNMKRSSLVDVEKEKVADIKQARDPLERVVDAVATHWVKTGHHSRAMLKRKMAQHVGRPPILHATAPTTTTITKVVEDL